MKTFKKCAAQGDVFFERVASIPDGLTAAPSERDGTTIVAHSETGHHHSFPKDSGVTLFPTSDPFVCFLRVESSLALLEHHRPEHTHEALGFEEGCFKIRRQRERARTPEGWKNRMVKD